MKKKKSLFRGILKEAKKGRGSVGSGNLYIVAILVGMAFMGYALVGGGLQQTKNTSPNSPVIILNPSPAVGADNLQLQTFGYITPIPTQVTKPSLCENGNVNNEPEILVYPNQSTPTLSIASGGQIKVWVNDEGAPYISAGEQVDNATGKITSPGNRTATAADGYLWEPAIYIAPQTAESGGTPHFPNYVKGQYSNTPGGSKGKGIKGAPRDPIPSGGGQLSEDFTAEFIWDVSGLSLAPGSYQAQFVIHDGDRDRGIGCYTLQIT